MSTVGKVLCGLILLPVVGWMWLSSSVAEWNRAYGKIEGTTRESITKAEVALVSTQSDVVRTRAQAILLQKEKESTWTASRALVSQLYRENSSSKETLDRFSLQFETAKAADAAAQDRKAKTQQLLVKTERDLATASAELVQLKEVNSNDRETLEQLRRELQSTLTQNQQFVQAQAGSIPITTSIPAATAVPALGSAITR